MSVGHQDVGSSKMPQFRHLGDIWPLQSAGTYRAEARYAMNELSMSDVLEDPMIRLMLRADRVPLGEFAILLERAASKRLRQFSTTPVRSNTTIEETFRHPVN
jgi:hypothetical protein